MINRKEYLDELIRWKDKDLIKVVTGIRRCGKSTLFELYIDYLKIIMSGSCSNETMFHLQDINPSFRIEKISTFECYLYTKKSIGAL